MRFDKRGIAALSIMIVLLSSALAMSSDLGISNVMNEGTESLTSSESAPPEYKPPISTVRVRVMAADMGYSDHYQGNESDLSLGPAYNLTVSIAGKYALTNREGEALLFVPEGNHTLSISRNRLDWWRIDVEVNEDRETFKVNSMLYRLAPLNITTDVKAVSSSALVGLTFRLPDTGDYYVGKAIMTYYTPSGEARIYREGLSAGFPADRVSNFWGEVGIARGRRSILSIDYSSTVTGGELTTKSMDVKDQPAYVVPWMTYLPIERVFLEEAQLGHTL
jgi:hypothetical protein